MACVRAVPFRKQGNMRPSTTTPSRRRGSRPELPLAKKFPRPTKLFGPNTTALFLKETRSSEMNVKSVAGRLEGKRARFALSSHPTRPLAGHWSLSDFIALKKPRADTLRCACLVAAVLSATISAPIFAQEVQAQMHRESISSKGIVLGAGRTKIAGYTWCLHNYSADAIDCSFSDRKQCEETAAGGLGECVFNSSSR
jgi:hypothetical protein